MQRALRSLSLVVVCVALPLSCARRAEPDPPSKPTTVAAADSNATTPTTLPLPVALQGASQLATSTSAPPSPSSGASTKGSASASPSASASASSGSSAEGNPLAPRLLGVWVFSRFDLDDPGTKARWSAVPLDDQKDILAAAPQATLTITKDTLATHLADVPEKKSTYTLEPPAPGAPEGVVILKTSDEGRKKVSFPDAVTMRVEDLDKKDSFVTLFVRKK